MPSLDGPIHSNHSPGRCIMELQAAVQYGVNIILVTKEGARWWDGRKGGHRAGVRSRAGALVVPLP